jgi:hypothetical protein
MTVTVTVSLAAGALRAPALAPHGLQFWREVGLSAINSCAAPTSWAPVERCGAAERTSRGLRERPRGQGRSGLWPVDAIQGARGYAAARNCEYEAVWRGGAETSSGRPREVSKNLEEDQDRLATWAPSLTLQMIIDSCDCS